MKKNIIIKQDGNKDCGVCCLLSIIRHYGGDFDKEELSYLLRQDNTGVNAYNLINGGKKIGLDGYAVKCEIDNSLLNKINFPVIAHVKNKNYYHFVVIYKIKNDTIYLMDPACGKKKIKIHEFNEVFLGTLIIIYPVKKLPLKTNNKSLLQILFNYVLNEKKIIILIFLLSLIIILFTILNNFYFKIIIDYFIKYKNLKYFVLCFILFTTIVLLKNIFDYFRQNFLLNLNIKISKFINFYIINHIFNLPINYFKNKPSGEVLSRINEMDNVKNFISDVILNIFINMLLIFISSLVLFFISEKLFFIMLIFIVIYFMVGLIYSKIFKNKIYEVEENLGEYNKILVENLNNYMSIKNLNILNNIKFKINLFYNKLLSSSKIFKKSLIFSIFIKNTINDILILIILSFGSILVINNLLSVGELVTFIFLMSFFIEPIKQIIDKEPEFRYAYVSYERINELLNIKEEKIKYNNLMIDGNIEIKNLIYSYNGVDDLLKNINLFFKKNERYFIHSKSGMGKSTLIKIILKYFTDYEGEVLINNKNIKDIDNGIINNSFSYVSQSENLFADTLENNILLDRKINNKKYDDVLKICNIDKIIKKKKLRNYFFIEENGFNLSGGEKQKVILARALLKDFNYLILDESMSEVGLQEEREILRNIFNYFNNKTIIYISHNLNTRDLFKERINFNKEVKC